MLANGTGSMFGISMVEVLISGMMVDVFFEWIYFRKYLRTIGYRTSILIYSRNVVVVLKM